MRTEFQTNGVKKNHLLQIRLDIQQKKRLEALSSASGFRSLSDFVRANLLNPTIESKLNRIMDILEKKLEKPANEKR